MKRRRPHHPLGTRRSRLPWLAVVLGLIWPYEAAAQVAVLGNLVHEHPLSRGMERSGSFRVINGSDRHQQVQVRQADYLFHADGRNEFPDPGTLDRSNAGWIAFAPSQFALGPGESVVVSYTVTVPDSGELRGSFWSVLLVESRPAAEVDLVLADDEVGLVPRVRYAVQVAVHLDGPADADLELESVRVERDASGNTALVVEVRNTGERGYRPALELHLFTASGERVGEHRQTRGLLYPGASIRQRFELGAIRPAPHEVLLTVDTGAPELVGAQFRIVP